jgi:hypothetical protein
MDVELDATYCFMADTNFWVGTVKRVNEKFVTLTESKWVGCTGIFAKFVATGECDSFDVMPVDLEVTISIGSVVNFFKFPHTLFRKQSLSK